MDISLRIIVVLVALIKFLVARLVLVKILAKYVKQVNIFQQTKNHVVIVFLTALFVQIVKPVLLVMVDITWKEPNVLLVEIIVLCVLILELVNPVKKDML